MHATEHSDRFTVVLPNGQPMDVFKADLRPETAAELRSMVVPAMAKGGRVEDDSTDPTRFGRKGTENAKRAKQDELDALEDQLVGLEQQAQDDAYEEVPTERESEAMAGADQERAMMDAAAARDRELAASRAEGSADADAALINRSDAIERKRDQDKANIAWLNNQNAEIAARNAAAVEADRQRAENAAASIGSPALAMVESDAAREARMQREARDALAAEMAPLRGAAPVDNFVAPAEFSPEGGTGYTPAVAPVPADRPATSLPQFQGATTYPMLGPLSAGAMVPNAPLPVMGRGELQRLEEDRAAEARKKATGTDVVAPPAPVEPPVDPDAELKARFKAFASGGSRGAPQIKVSTVGQRTAAPFAMPASYEEAIKLQYDLNERSAKLQADTAAEVERLSTEKGIKEQQMLDRDNAQSAEETRRLDQMREEAFNGKIDVNRAFDRMDGGQRALSLIGLILGGIGAGNTGVNAAVGVMERMIDRDIDAQAKDLGRKQTAYSNAIQQGYHAEQARQRARLEAMSVLQGSIDRAAMKNGSERALLAGQAANAALSAKVATDTMAMQDKHLERQRQEINSEYDREFKNATLRMQAEKMRQDREAAALAAWTALRKPDPKLAALEHVLPDKSVVIASNPTSKAKLEIIQAAHSDMMAKIAEARKLREDYGGGTIVPNSKILRATGLPAAVYADEAASLAGQMELAWLRGEAAGAYDVGSGKKAAEVMPSAADLGDDAFKNKIDRLEKLANEKFRAGIVSLVRPASAQRF